MKEFIESNIKSHLESLGLSETLSGIYAQKGYEHYQSSVCNTRDAFKDACDHAGMLAQQNVSGFKYKPPKAKSRARTKKPQEAFNFGK